MEVKTELFDKILVAVDGSKQALKAIDYATTIADSCKTKELALIHVIPDPGNEFAYAESFFVTTTINALKKAGDKILDEAEKTVAGKKLTAKVTSKQVVGDPGNEIVKLAKDGKYDLIVIGNKGVGGVTGWVLGSVSTKVVNHATVPVFVIK